MSSNLEFRNGDVLRAEQLQTLFDEASKIALYERSIAPGKSSDGQAINGSIMAGTGSVASGNIKNITNSPNCFVFGEGLQADMEGQFIIGKYNAITQADDYVFVIANGNATNRKNLLTLNIEGQLKINQQLMATKDYVDSAINGLITGPIADLTEDVGTNTTNITNTNTNLAAAEDRIVALEDYRKNRYPKDSVVVFSNKKTVDEVKALTGGGNWEIIDQEFSPKQETLDGAFTSNSYTENKKTNSYLHSCGLKYYRGGHNIQIQLSFVLTDAIAQKMANSPDQFSKEITHYPIGKIDFSKLGIKGGKLPFAYLGDVGATADSHNGHFIYSITADGEVRLQHWVPYKTDGKPDGYKDAKNKGSNHYITFNLTLYTSSMADDACSKFYYKQTADNFIANGGNS